MKHTPIIILNWNGITDTLECIESVLLMKNVLFHIHLIDNHSDNLEGDKLTNKFNQSQNVTVHKYDENFGFTKAHIKIWEEVLKDQNSEYIALLNNDTSVSNNWLEELLKVAKSHNADVVSSKMIDYYDRTKMDNAGHFMLNTGEIIPVGHGEQIENHIDVTENMGACAGACLYKASMIKHIGFFDPYFSTGYEDAEFGLRAVISNYKCIYAPEAIVYHKMGQSIKKIFDESYSLMIQTSILYSYFKLMPLSKILYDIPSFVIKNLSMLIIDVLFFRFKYLKILFESWKDILAGLNQIKHKRAHFFNTVGQPIKFNDLRKKIIWFLPFDVRRFVNIIILRRDSSLDSYAKH